MAAADNPYRSPESAVEDAAGGVEWVPAGKWRRFFNLLLDQLVMFGLMSLGFTAVYVVADDAWLDGLEALSWWHEQLIGMVVGLGYYIGLEASCGRSIGKLLTGTRVVDEAGHPPRFGQVVLRSLSRLVPFEAFSVLLGDDADPRGWHDRWSRTRVVRRRPVRAEA